MIPRVDLFKCDGCNICVERCPAQVMGLINNKAAILVDLCEECGICAEVCPIDAIHFRLPNKGVEVVHESYASPREDRPTPGNWQVGVVRGYDGEGHYKE
ncbi:MAG: 4Fe-4S dicluster domain-containing protein [Candidatus Latescibacteria bacterium]|nr:4Fe-4S dicluster domain-containing protein [Candidatus Latescibacterota bacterium]NIM64464.1 4Fe-4S dicluster domain-containing protein [Candidatus Latescibacterota bacterium]NIO00617.1 4Fe-4S dicluster domain-containing protein [Candidatus Latescibacterota bacterium]NIO27018.1 4Fe-4S dicluster domain-containing protein [Candidatus Latescibacterota bacterium]NIO56095.1 4Fe-4S dicluster domain-containing protein [Candidatus Latescibacterota bacterium]